MKEKQEYKNGPASENDASDPGPLHRAVVETGAYDVVGVLRPPSQHARVAITSAEEVGELKDADEEDGDGVAVRGER